MKSPSGNLWLAADVGPRIPRLAGKETASTDVAGVLRNGVGPTLLLRTDPDALPVTEKTGLPYASKARVTAAASELLKPQ